MRYLLILSILVSPFTGHAQAPKENYPVDSASVEHQGVPKGEILQFTFSSSKIFPGTTRFYSVYVPAQYKGDQPACVYINQDGIQFKAPIVFDNLINSKEMPVTIGVFVTPGVVKAQDSAAALDRYNRSFEYDGLGDDYARFLLEELLPEVEKQKTSDGHPIKLSKNGNDRAIGGSSSGAVCAFTAAWERPKEFSRVFSSIGTYVGLRGADRYPTLIRKYEPKPLKIFLQDGANDLNIYGGDWWKANETMERALAYSGYQVQHAWGEGGHNTNQATAVFPAAMRWLWKDYPTPVSPGKSKNQYLNELLIDGEDWQLVGEGYIFTEGIIANPSGQVYYQDIPNAKTYRIMPDGKPELLKINSLKAGGTAFGPDGKRYVGAGKQVLSYDSSGKKLIITDNISVNDLVVGKNGNIYATEPKGYADPGNLILIKNGMKKVVDVGLHYNNGLAFTPDQTQLYVDESSSAWVWIYQVQKDGSLTSKQKFGRLHTPPDESASGSDGMKTDTAGRLFVASKLGVQVLDQVGRVNAILPVPTGQVSNLCFGGENFDILYVTCVDKVYRRKLHTRGANTFEVPVKSIKPHL